MRLIITICLMFGLSGCLLAEDLEDAAAAYMAKDFARALKHSRLAAERNDALGQFNLGLMYEKGEGVPKDEKEAVNWYRKAAEQNDAMAQNNLGELYRVGEVIPHDFKEALKWYRASANQGHPTALANLGEVFEKGQGVSSDCVQAYVYYSLAFFAGFKPVGKLLEGVFVKLTPAQRKEAQRLIQEKAAEIEKRKAGKWK